MAMKRASSPANGIATVSSPPQINPNTTGPEATRPRAHVDSSSALPVADQKQTKQAGATTEPPQLLHLPIAQVRDHARNARHLYDPTRIDEMAASIARDGQMMPAVVMEDPEQPGTYLLIEGRYRKRALQSLGRETLLAIVVEPLPELEAYRLSLILNEERNAQTDLDNALSWKMLQDDGLFTSQEHIAEYLGITQSKVSKTLSLLELPVGVLTIMKTSPQQFGLRIGYELRQLSRQLAPAEIEAVAEQIREGKLTVAALEKMRTRAEKIPTTRERARAYPLKSGALTLGTLREFDDGRVKIDLAGLDPLTRKDLIAAVQKVLDAG